MPKRIIETMVAPSRSRENSFTLSPQQIHCICQKTYQENNNFMVGCNICFKWYHTKCIDFDDGLADIADYFHCTSCTEKKSKPMLNYLRHMQQKKIDKGNTTVMDINQITSNSYDKENYLNRNVPNNLAFPTRKIQSLITESDEISIFSNKGLPNIDSCCWLNSCLQVILGSVVKEFLLRPEFQSFPVCQYLQLIYR